MLAIAADLCWVSALVMCFLEGLNGDFSRTSQFRNSGLWLSRIWGTDLEVVFLTDKKKTRHVGFLKLFIYLKTSINFY